MMMIEILLILFIVAAMPFILLVLFMFIAAIMLLFTSIFSFKASANPPFWGQK